MSFRLGIFGGTFDPVHLGHLLLAEMARTLLGLEKVTFVPAARPPHKHDVWASPEQRYRMTQLACDPNPHFEVSDVELRRDGPSYTVETLRTLRDQAPRGVRSYLLIGADSAAGFETWKDHDVLLEESSVVVLARHGMPIDRIPQTVADRATFISTPRIEVSSSEIRRLVGKGESVRYQVTDEVDEYIRTSGLYLSKEACS